jgi:hypothetical protein
MTLPIKRAALSGQPHHTVLSNFYKTISTPHTKPKQYQFFFVVAFAEGTFAEGTFAEGTFAEGTFFATGALFPAGFLLPVFFAVPFAASAFAFFSSMAA